MHGRCAALAVVLILGATGRADAAEKALWGPLELPGGESAFSMYKRLGVDTFQSFLSWANVAPTRPTHPRDPYDPAYLWPGELDSAVDEATSREIEVGLLVQHTPSWANGERSEIWAPSDPADFADFLTAVSRRYPTVRRWMIWGEPNRTDRFLPGRPGDPEAPRAYARLLDAAYAALKGVSPRNIVIGGMTWTGGDVKPAAFLDALRLPSGRPPRLDWYGHNPFPFRFPNLRHPAVPGGYRDISDLDTFSREVRVVYGPRVRLWLSEFTVQSEQESSSFELFVSRSEQAHWLSAAYTIADRLSSVAGLGWFNLLDQEPGPDSANWGLLDARGRPKPSYRAFLRAPARRFRPEVRSANVVRRSRGRVTVVLHVRWPGLVTVSLLGAKGQPVASVRQRLRTVRPRRLELATRGAKPGRYRLVVRGPRAERVTRRLIIR